MRGVIIVAIENRVLEAKNNHAALNDLLSEYKPFIQKVVYDTCNRYVEWGKDEELSIGLLAFEEAINRFDPNKGGFINLARTIIKSRVIDYLRSENRHVFSDIEEHKDDIVIEATNPLADEIKDLQLYLSKYEISFYDLPDISPVKRKLREELMYTAKVIAKEPDLMMQILEKKQLPTMAAARKSGVSYKKIERNRVYIITMTLIWYLDLPLLQEYLK